MLESARQQFLFPTTSALSRLCRGPHSLIQAVFDLCLNSKGRNGGSKQMKRPCGRGLLPCGIPFPAAEFHRDFKPRHLRGRVGSRLRCAMCWVNHVVVICNMFELQASQYHLHDPVILDRLSVTACLRLHPTRRCFEDPCFRSFIIGALWTLPFSDQTPVAPKFWQR